VEKVYYQDETLGISITEVRATIGGTMYPVANITSVRVTKDCSFQQYALLAAVVGLPVSWMGYAAQNYPAMGLGVVWVALMVTVSKWIGPRFEVAIGAAGGERPAYRTRYRDVATKIGEGLNMAIIERGRR